MIGQLLRTTCLAERIAINTIYYFLLPITFSIAFGGCTSSQSGNDGNNTQLAASISINLADPGIPSNRSLLGNNIEWVYNGDGLVSASGAPVSAVMNTVAQTGPSMLRYPGGSLADTYHWQDGVGPIGGRGSDRDLNNSYQQVIFGTDEFVQLSNALGVTSMITVNAITGTAQEAANWVAYVNGTGTQQQEHVHYWEIGNEPYLIESNRPDLAITPARFASNADSVIAAMRAVDANIKVGIPLRSNTIGAIVATPYAGYNNTVLSSITNHIDFVSVHDAYFPFASATTTISDLDLYSSAMAASSFMAADLDATTMQVNSLRPEGSLPIAVTEYNAIFGLSSAALQQKSSSLAGALYVADILRVLAYRTDILCANYWSLSGNGYFGTVDTSGNPRPSYYVLLAYGRLLQGQVIPVNITSSAFTNPQVGAIPAGTAPVITAIATRFNKTLRLLVINKHSTSHVNLSLVLANGVAIQGTNYFQLTGNDLFSGAQGYSTISWTSGTQTVNGSNIVLNLPPHSFTLYEMPLL